MPSLVRAFYVHEFVFLLFFPSFHTLSPMMMIVGLILYLLRARGGSPPRVLRGGGGRRAPICLGSRASLAPPPRLKMKSLLSREKKCASSDPSRVESSRARVPWFSYARTPVPTAPKGSRRPSSAHRFFAGFKDEGDSGGDLFLGATTAPARCAGVEGPSVFVRRYRVPQALHSMGLDAGPRRHCGESAFRGFRGTREDAEGISSASVLETDEKHADARIGVGAEARGRSRPLPRARSRASLERETRPTLGVPQMKKAKGERRGTYRQRRSGRTVPPA